MKTSNLLLTASLILSSSIASADFFVVDRFEDAPDTFSGDGQCKGLNMVGTTCSLRAAIMEANATVGPHTILIPAGTDFVLSHTGDDEDGSLTGDLDIIEDITIQNGLTQGFVIDGNFSDRVFHVHASGKLTLVNGHVKNGEANTPNTFQGGAIKVEAGGELVVENVDFSNNIANRGGAIFNSGTATITDSYIHHNAITSENEPFALPSQGSAVFNHHIMEILTSTLAYNGMVQSNPNNTTINTNEYTIHINPNGINAVQPDTRISNSTIAQNKRGGIQMEGGVTDIVQTTIANNEGQGIRFIRRDGIYKGTLQVYMRNSLIANNGGQDCNDLQAFYDNVDAAKEIDFLENFNMSSDAKCGFKGIKNLQNANVEFNGSLNDWGGETPTLLPTSSQNNDILDFITSMICTDVDQRGEQRPLDGRNNGQSFCDVGSVELNLAEDFVDSDLIFKNSFDPLF